MFSFCTNPDACSSRLQALNAADAYLRQGHDAFTFERADGSAFTVTRDQIAPYLAAGCRLVFFTSGRPHRWAGDWVDVAGHA